MRSRLIHKNSVLALLSILFCVIGAQAQSSSFTYQGRLTDGGTQPTATYDMEFRLFDALEGGNPLPLGNPITITFTDPPRGVSVANGVFTVQLDFGGAAAFDGNARWLQIAVKKPADSSFVTLPRQPITSTPYAITATNSSQLDGRAASDYVLTTDSRMNDARTPSPGSVYYIQNNPPQQQVLSNFNISGNGTAGGTLNGNIVNATEFDLNGTPILRAGISDLFVGFGASVTKNPTARNNSFFGVKRRPMARARIPKGVVSRRMFLCVEYFMGISLCILTSGRSRTRQTLLRACDDFASLRAPVAGGVTNLSRRALGAPHC